VHKPVNGTLVTIDTFVRGYGSDKISPLQNKIMIFAVNHPINKRKIDKQICVANVF